MANEQPTKEGNPKPVQPASAGKVGPAAKAAPAGKPAPTAGKPAAPAAGKVAAPAGKPAVAKAPAGAAPAAKAPPAAKGAAPAGAIPPGTRAVPPGVKAGPPPAAPPAAAPEESEGGGFAAAIHGLFRSTPSWLASMILHVVVLVVLALITVPEPYKSDVDDLIAESNPGDSVEELSMDEPMETVKFEDAPMSDVVPTTTTEISAVEMVEDPTPTLSSATELADIGDVGAMVESMMTSAGSSAKGDLSQRGSTAARKAAVAQGGGSAGSEQAVAKALEWLAKHQNPDGSWTFDHRLSPKCGKRCDHPGSMKEARFAATGFGLLPFLGAGQTHKEGKYKENVKAGLAFLVQNMKGGSMFESGGSLYSHGIASIALCESYAMTQDKNLLQPAQAAIRFTCEAQDPQLGGWQYSPKNGSDTSGMGWQLMALKSGHMGYLAVPESTIKNAVKFLNSVQADGGATYGYATPGSGPATNAIGLLSRMYLGWKKDNPALKKGVEILSAMGPSMGPGQGSMYYNYYATQVMHHYEGEHWVRWNEKMRDFLVNEQSKKDHMAGSWYLAGDHGSELGGRLYCTALATMTLEVYYRHLPLYRNNSTEDEFEE